MDDEKFTILISEIKNWGPSPFASDADQPMPCLFYNEMAGMAGTMTYEGFGKPETVYILPTSFRWIVYNKRKRGGDRCRSYWHNLDFGEWHWEDPDGFVIAGVETTPLEFVGPKTNQDLPVITWQTHFVSPEGEKKLFEEVRLAMQQYNFHQENRLVRWDQPITLPINDEPRTELAASWYLTKLELSSKMPGTVDLDALWLLHDDPFKASETEVGYIDPESSMHPDNATRGRKAVNVSKVSSNTGRGQTAKKVKRTAIKAVQTYAKVKGAADTAQKVASVVKDGGGAVKGAVEGVKQAAQVARGAGPRFCGNCGAPLKTGILFCGNCGQKLAQKVVEKTKDELKGNVEEKVIEKVEKALDDEEKPKGKLKESPPKPEKAAETEEAPKTKAPASEGAQQATKGKCPHCNCRVQPKWTFCPDCGQELAVFCPQCGEAIERGWKFCPHCTAEITSEE